MFRRDPSLVPSYSAFLNDIFYSIKETELFNYMFIYVCLPQSYAALQTTLLHMKVKSQWNRDTEFLYFMFLVFQMASV